MISKKIFITLKHEGVPGLLRKIKSRLYLRTNIFRIDIENADLTGPLIDQRLIMKEMIIDDLSLMVECYRDEIPTEKEAQLKEWMRKPDEYSINIVKDEYDRIMNYGCVSYKSFFDPTMNYLFHLNEKEFFYFDTYTFKEHRNRGAQKIIAALTTIKLQNEGRNIGYCMIDEGNVYSERAMKHLGFQPAGHIHHLKIFSYKFNISRWYDSTCRHTH